jgi:hypothetical protein
MKARIEDNQLTIAYKKFLIKRPVVTRRLLSNLPTRYEARSAIITSASAGH